MKNNSQTIAHIAAWIVVDPWTIIKTGIVIVEDDRIIAVEKGKGKIPAGARTIDHGPGVLLPAWVNAHTHLELSALKGKTRQDAGFLDWVKSVITLRDAVSQEVLLDAAAVAIDRMIENGTALVGEISTFGLTRSLFLNSDLAGVWFMEYLGAFFFAPEDTPVSFKDQRVSVAGHAPHTSTADLLTQLKNHTRKTKSLFAIHLAESAPEQAFLTTGKGAWATFLSDRGLDPALWKTAADGPVRYCDRLGILDDQTLAVHLVFADQSDIRLLSERGVRICLCPRSNMQLHQRLPDLPGMLSAGLRPCLGTDSLASNDTLDMADEIAFTARHFPAIPPADILAMATVYGAESLGFDDRFGRIMPGKAAYMQYFELSARTPNDLLERIVSDRTSPAVMIRPSPLNI